MTSCIQFTMSTSLDNPYLCTTDNIATNIGAVARPVVSTSMDVGGLDDVSNALVLRNNEDGDRYAWMDRYGMPRDCVTISPPRFLKIFVGKDGLEKQNGSLEIPGVGFRSITDITTFDKKQFVLVKPNHMGQSNNYLNNSEIKSLQGSIDAMLDWLATARLKKLQNNPEVQTLLTTLSTLSDTEIDKNQEKINTSVLEFAKVDPMNYFECMLPVIIVNGKYVKKTPQLKAKNVNKGAVATMLIEAVSLQLARNIANDEMRYRQYLEKIIENPNGDLQSAIDARDVQTEVRGNRI